MTENMLYGPVQIFSRLKYAQLRTPACGHILPSETPGAGRRGSLPKPGRQTRTLVVIVVPYLKSSTNGKGRGAGWRVLFCLCYPPVLTRGGSYWTAVCFCFPICRTETMTAAVWKGGSEGRLTTTRESVKSNTGGKEYRDTQKQGRLSQAGDKQTFKWKIVGNWSAVDQPSYRYKCSPQHQHFYLFVFCHPWEAGKRCRSHLETEGCLRQGNWEVFLSIPTNVLCMWHMNPGLQRPGKEQPLPGLDATSVSIFPLWAGGWDIPYLVQIG